MLLEPSNVFVSLFLAIMVCCSRFRLGSSYSPKQTLTFNHLEFVFAGRVNAPLVAVMAAMTARTKNSLEEEVTSHWISTLFYLNKRTFYTFVCIELRIDHKPWFSLDANKSTNMKA